MEPKRHWRSAGSIKNKHHVIHRAGRGNLTRDSLVDSSESQLRAEPEEMLLNGNLSRQSEENHFHEKRERLI